MNEFVKYCKVHGDLTIDQVDKRSDQPNGYKCKQCRLVYNRKFCREWRQDNSELVNLRVKEDRLKDPERYREYDRKQRANNLEGHRYRDVLTKHQVTAEEYESLRGSQNDLCAICNLPETKKSRTKGETCRLTLDHCHKCEDNGQKGIKVIRGMLCHHCNVGVGNFKDDITLLQKAIEYLKRHEHRASNENEKDASSKETCTI